MPETLKIVATPAVLDYCWRNRNQLMMAENATKIELYVEKEL